MAQGDANRKQVTVVHNNSAQNNKTANTSSNTFVELIVINGVLAPDPKDLNPGVIIQPSRMNPTQ